ncbi:hypothetical protein J6TS1_50200 [Siminovitchia terrae]|uniref:Lipoprotein n=1 Tax=Siminovitchia terrae TaxID=1914933 RepID=A0ABQ4L5H6_SIMTE|nr:hypothetical protein [Siminovitchia terrae]GIN99150.1 hypothetical protein J6TS1_50200 [Siminovitchia terrae]
MKRILIGMILLLIVLSACNSVDTRANKETETNYYLSMSDESEHWKLNGYEIIITSKGYKAGNGILKMKDGDEQREGFLSYDVYTIVGGEENRFHGGSVSGDADITEMTTGTIVGEEENLKEFPKIDEIYMTVTWSDDDTDGEQEEKINLYKQDKNGESFLDSE